MGRLFLTLFLGAALAGPAMAREIVAAAFVEPTDAYGHGALPGGEYAGLEVRFDDGSRSVIRYPDAVYEDTAPRLHDFDGDGAPEVVVALSGYEVGAMVQVLGVVDGALTPIAQSAPIGQRHRWLAIAGIADLDGGGRDEIAYVDRPHLAKTLRLLTVAVTADGLSLTPMAALAGVSNHRYGAPMIEGGIRSCPGALPVIVTADADWQSVVETRWAQGRLVADPVAPYAGPESLARRLECG